LADQLLGGLNGKLLDLFGQRLAEMDRTGIEIAVLSLNADSAAPIPWRCWVRAERADF
jgi:hypothetical protein